MFDEYRNWDMPISPELKKALRNLENTIGMARKGACLMSENKRAELRRKRKKKNKK